MEALPSGFVIFMFTDLEGSTRIQQRLGAAYTDLLAQHDEILMAAISDHRGFVLNSMGDGVFAVFSDASAAVASSAQIQRSMRATSWPNRTDVRVRIGLHGALVTPAGDRYVSLDVNKAARVSNAAYGGQVLATSSVVEAAGGNDDSHWVSVGQYRLKDFSEPVDLHSLRIPGSLDFTGTRAVPITLHNVPHIPTSFVGREEEVSALAEAVTNETTLITLIGPGGIGKTRLALEVARRSVPLFDGGCWVVLLANASGGEVVDRTLRALAVPDRADVPATDRLIEVVASRRLLLVLDNCENVIDDVGALVNTLRTAASSVSILATSREPLLIAGERQWHVDPLPPATAVELFIARARDRDPLRAAGVEVARVAPSICAAVDHLPFAVELAAARLGYVSVDELMQMLKERPSSLASDRRDGEVRHQSLRSLVQWSYELLSADAQAVFRSLSIFRSTFDRRCAVEVGGASGRATVEEALDELIAKSLVARSDDPRRFRLLTMIRDFASAQLGPAEAAEASSRHLRLFVRLSEDARRRCEGPDPMPAVEEVGGQYDDFTAAMRNAAITGHGDSAARIASGLFTYFKMTGRLNDGRLWLEHAATSAEDPALAAVTLSECGIMALSQGDVEAAIRMCRDAYDRLVALGADQHLSMAQLHLADALTGRKDVAAARALYAGVAQTTSDDLLRARAFRGLGWAAIAEGDLPAAEGHLLQAHETAGQVGSARYFAIMKANLALLEYQLENYSQAEELLLETIDICKQIERTTLPDACYVLSQLYVKTGRADLAAHWEQEARVVADSIGMAQTALMRPPDPDRARRSLTAEG